MLVMYIIFYLEKLNMSYLIIESLSQKKIGIIYVKIIKIFFILIKIYKIM